MRRLADLGTDTVRLLVPGSAICLEALSRLGFDALVVGDQGLREGLSYEILTVR